MRLLSFLVLNEVLSITAQEFADSSDFYRQAVNLLNEVLSITAQEWYHPDMPLSRRTVLNEVLSITAQEFLRIRARFIHVKISSMKS